MTDIITNKLMLFMLLTLLIATCFINTSNGQELTIQTLQGKVTGFMANSNTKAFLGIRYAETTGGNNRFRPPVELADTSSNTVTNATSYGNICIQQSSDNIYSQPASEDCLFLNIWTPSDASASKQYPVMVWVHGGNFIYGSGNIYSADYWVKLSQDNNVPIVVVTINYRLGVFGFMSDSLFGAENGRTNTNFGLLDQLTALKWIKKNIANFGGNPNKMTISGESAGAVSSVILLTSPLLYNTSSSYYADIKGAIVQSGTSLKWNMQIQQSVAQGYATNLKNYFGCTDSSSALSCLRNLDATLLNNYQEYNTSDKFSPAIDNYVILRNIFDSYDSGLYKKVNLLIGVTRNEMNGFTCGILSSNIGDTQMKAVFSQYFGLTKMQQFYPQLSNYYTLAKYDNNLAYLNDILSNSNVQCNTRYLAATVSQQVYNTYMYTYDHYFYYTPQCQKSAHAIELTLQFPSLFLIRGATKAYTMTSDEVELSRNLIVYWSNFVSSGSPNMNAKLAVNLKNQTYWERYTTCNDTQIILQAGGNVLNNTMYSKVCPFWNPYDEVPTIACNATNPGPSQPIPESSTTPTPQTSNSPSKNSTNPTTSTKSVNGTVSGKVNQGISNHSFSFTLILVCVVFLLLASFK